MASGHPPRASGTKGPKQTQEIPTEWRIELPESGANADSEFGGCRSIEAGYDRGPVLGQGTYGEVRQGTCAGWATCILFLNEHRAGCMAGNC